MRKAFGGHVVLDGVDLDIHAHQTLTLIGESGSGKTVLLKMLVGLVEPDAGQILFRGTDVASMSPEALLDVRRRAGYVFQNDALFDSMTVEDNVAYGLVEHTDMGAAARRDRVVACLEMVGLSARILDAMPADLSGGMRRRVALARTIAIEPEIIIYDEPMAGLDPQNITRIGRLIADLSERLGTTSIIATHEVVTAFQISERIAMLHDHRVAHQGTPAEMRASRAPEVHAFLDEALSVMDRLDQLARS